MCKFYYVVIYCLIHSQFFTPVLKKNQSIIGYDKNGYEICDTSRVKFIDREIAYDFLKKMNECEDRSNNDSTKLIKIDCVRLDSFLIKSKDY